MQNRFWIFLMLAFVMQMIDNQSLNAQADFHLADAHLTEYIKVNGLKISSEISKSDKMKTIFATPIRKGNKEIQKLNSSNWNWLENEKFLFQKISSPAQTEVFVRFDKIDLETSESIKIVDLVNGVILEKIENNKKFHVGGPYQTEEIGIVVNGSSESVIENITIGEVYIGAMEFGYNSSYKCHKNIACEEGIEYAEQERAVVRITMVLEEGIGYCSGSLINNTENDRNPLLLSAFHCQDGFTPYYDMWSFDFGYESFSCADPETEPSSVKVTGAELLSGYAPSDMLLLRITDTLPETSNAFFTGWNRKDDYEADGGVMIHHPNGDIKKISVDVDTIVPFRSTLNWDNGIVTPSGSHLVTRFDESSYQGGSSGAPLLDVNGHIIGQLHGGPSDDVMCSIGIGYHGKLSQSWEGGGTPETSLKSWLDPNAKGDTILSGIELNAEGSAFISFIGRLVTPDGIAIPDVRVSIKGDKEESFMTGPDGRFVFDDLPKSGAYTLEFVKDTNHGNGVSALDLVQIMNHILGTSPLFGIFQQRSADANDDGQVSSLDLVQILNLIIGKTDRFPNNTSWKFEPGIIEMTSENSASFNRQIIGYKIGDVNFSANPRR